MFRFLFHLLKFLLIENIVCFYDLKLSRSFSLFLFLFLFLKSSFLFFFFSLLFIIIKCFLSKRLGKEERLLCFFTWIEVFLFLLRVFLNHLFTLNDRFILTIFDNFFLLFLLFFHNLYFLP